MPRAYPKVCYTRDEWSRVPPEQRLEAGDRAFTYLTHTVGLRTERTLYEVEFVDTPVPGHGLLTPLPMVSFFCAACRSRTLLAPIHDITTEICRACGAFMTSQGQAYTTDDRLR